MPMLICRSSSCCADLTRGDAEALLERGHNPCCTQNNLPVFVMNAKAAAQDGSAWCVGCRV